MHWVLIKHLRPLEIVFITRYLLIVLHRLRSLKANQTDIIKTVESVLQSRNTWGATWYFPIEGIKVGVLTCRQISSSLWEMSRVLALRKPYCGMRSKRVGVHFFRQISVSTTLHYLIVAEYTPSDCDWGKVLSWLTGQIGAEYLSIRMKKA